MNPHLIARLLAGALLLTFHFSLFTPLRAQCVGNVHHNLDINHAHARFNNGAIQFFDLSISSEYIVPANSGKAPIFTQGLWVGGLSPQGLLHVAASTYNQQGPEYYTGPCRTPLAFSCEPTFSTATITFRNGLKYLSNGKVLALDSTQILIYDPVTQQTLTRALPQTRGWLDALELADGRVLLFGDELYPTKLPVLYMDTVNYQFTTGPTLTWFHRESTADQLPDGRVLIAGVVGCDILVPATDSVYPVPDMIYARRNHATVRLPNGNVMAFGGGASLGGTGLTLKTQYFDDSLGYWIPGPDMLAGRNCPDITRLANGNYFIVGGTSLSSLTEIFDPIADSIFAGPTLSTPFMEVNSHLLPGGRVVITERVQNPIRGSMQIIDLGSGQAEEVRISHLGHQSVLIGPEELIVAKEYSSEFQRIHLNGPVQDPHRWQYIWKVGRTEIDQFRADFLASTVDFAQYPDIETWPAHGDVVMGEDRNLAPFVDVNQDGLYRPALDGDYPCIVGDQALWWVFNDQGPHFESNGLPMNLQFEAMAYAFDCNSTPCPDTSLDYATFLHLEVSNHSDTAWSQIHLGGYYDVDIGYYGDDFIGTDSTLGLAFGFNGDNEDESTTGYGNSPPAWGITVLPNGQLDLNSVMTHDLIFSGQYNSLPETPAHYYNYLQARWRDSLHLVNNGSNGYPGSATGPATNFMFPSTQGFCGGFLTGWSELTAGTVPSDRRLILGSGPFDLQPGESIDYDLAFPWVRDSNHTQSVCALKDATALMRDWWQNQLDRTCFNITVAAPEQRELGQGLRIIPNPVTGTAFTVAWDLGIDSEAALQILDINGRLIKSIPLPIGSTRQDLSTRDLPAGLYIARLLGPVTTLTAKVIIW